jgi:bifunctional polynucleotide phosphatase/kinase
VALVAPELVLFVGMPCLGKSTFYRTNFAGAGYVHINQDTLKTRQKCVNAAEEALSEGKCCVVGRYSVRASDIQDDVKPAR